MRATNWRHETNLLDGRMDRPNTYCHRWITLITSMSFLPNTWLRREVRSLPNQDKQLGQCKSHQAPIKDKTQEVTKLGSIVKFAASRLKLQKWKGVQLLSSSNTMNFYLFKKNKISWMMTCDMQQASYKITCLATNKGLDLRHSFATLPYRGFYLFNAKWWLYL